LAEAKTMMIPRLENRWGVGWWNAQKIFS